MAGLRKNAKTFVIWPGGLNISFTVSALKQIPLFIFAVAMLILVVISFANFLRDAVD